MGHCKKGRTHKDRLDLILLLEEQGKDNPPEYNFFPEPWNEGGEEYPGIGREDLGEVKYIRPTQEQKDQRGDQE